MLPSGSDGSALTCPGSWQCQRQFKLQPQFLSRIILSSKYQHILTKLWKYCDWFLCSLLNTHLKCFNVELLALTRAGIIQKLR